MKNHPASPAAFALALLPPFFAPLAWSAAPIRVAPAGEIRAGIRFAPPAAALAAPGASLPAPLAAGLRSAASLPLAGAPTPVPAASVAPAAADALKQAAAELGPEAITAPDYKPGLIRHIVLFRYKDSVTDEQKAEVKRRFLALHQLCARGSCPYITSIETGAQNSGEGVDQKLEQAFLVTFRSEGDRNYYVGRPIVVDPRFYDAAHQAFKEFVGPLLHEPVNPTGVLVFDYAVEASVSDAARGITARMARDAKELSRRLAGEPRDAGAAEDSSVSGGSAGRGPDPLGPPRADAPRSPARVPAVESAAAPVSAGRRLLASALPLLVWPVMLGAGALLLAVPALRSLPAAAAAGLFAYLAWKTYKPADPARALARLGRSLAALAAWTAAAAPVAAILHAVGFSSFIVGAATAFTLGFGYLTYVAFRGELGAQIAKAAYGLALGIGHLLSVAVGFIAVAFVEGALAASPRQDWVIHAGMIGAAALFLGYIYTLSRAFDANKP